MEHGPTAAGPNDRKLTRPGVRTRSQHKSDNTESQKKKDHLSLSFSFVLIVSLSFWQKVYGLSISLGNN
jgi:hypothetical protein